MILFKDWQISVRDKLLAMQFDNLTRELQVVGEIPKDWNWEALVEVNEYFDIIPLPFQPDGSLKVVLTAEQVAINGYYTIQLRGTRGDEVKHTNSTWVYVGDSLSGDEHWPEIPSAFTETERSIKAAAKEVEEFASIAKDAANSVEDAGESINQTLFLARTFAETSQAYAKGGTAFEYDDKTGLPTSQIDVEGAKFYMEEAKKYAEAAADGSGFQYKIGLGLKVTEDQTLVVDSAENFDGDNDRPASAALVKTQLGNIEAFLATI